MDFSREARKRAVEALDALEEKGTVDELGVGMLRDAFADKMFPGTSTIQTRAKYFVLVPCCVRLALENEARGNTKGRIREELRDIEKKCCLQMGESLDDISGSGVIGWRNRNRRAWIQRTPTEIYWAGLRTLEILRAQESPGAWLTHAARQVAESGGAERNVAGSGEGIGDDADTRLAEWMGDWELPKGIYRRFEVDFAKGVLSLDLTPEEASFLRERILAANGTKNSLLAWCLKTGVTDSVGDELAANEGKSPFGRFARSVRMRVPTAMADVLDLAMAFNRLVFPARVLYNVMLDLPGSGAAELWNRIKMQVPGWMEGIDLDAICRFGGMSPAHPLARFMRELREAFFKGDFSKAETVIEKRECAIKGKGRAKLKHPEKAGDAKWVGGGWLDYRLGNAMRILRDIAGQGMGESPEGGGDV